MENKIDCKLSQKEIAYICTILYDRRKGIKAEIESNDLLNEFGLIHLGVELEYIENILNDLEPVITRINDLPD